MINGFTKIVMVLCLVVIATSVIISPVSANLLVEVDDIVDGLTESYYNPSSHVIYYRASYLYTNNIEAISDVDYVYSGFGSSYTGDPPSSSYTQIDIKSSGGILVGRGGIGTYVYNTTPYTGEGYIWIDVDEWNVGSLTGSQRLTLYYRNSSTMYESPVRISLGGTPSTYSNFLISIGTIWNGNDRLLAKSVNTYTVDYQWKNIVNITGNSFNLIRSVDGKSSYSKLSIHQINLDTWINDTGTVNVTKTFTPPIEWSVTNSRGSVYVGTENVYGELPGPKTLLTLNILNSETSQPLSECRVSITSFKNGYYTEIVNQTVMGGVYQGNLTVTGYNTYDSPDFYRLRISAADYEPVVSYTNFEITKAMVLYQYMEPTTGAPADPNNTFIEFYVSDAFGNPISNASVSIDYVDYSRYTNDGGFTQFKVPKNEIYSYTVSKLGYITKTDDVIVGANSRYRVYVELSSGTEPEPPVPGMYNVTISITDNHILEPINESHLIIKSYKGGAATEIVNQYLPAGVYNGHLLPTGGGNPDFYRAYVSAADYEPERAYTDFLVTTDPYNLILYMTPTGYPVEENYTYLDFYVSDEYGNPVNSASIYVNQLYETRTTNADGNARFTAYKNRTYTYTVSKSGYITASGTIVAGAEPRYWAAVELISGTATAPITVYIQNSQTASLIANARIVISVSQDGTISEIINQTVPSGVYEGQLQLTGGVGNPEFYRLSVSAPGYEPESSPYEFSMSQPLTIHRYLAPLTGGPENETFTYLSFYVYDTNDNPLMLASVYVPELYETRGTQASGFAQFTAPKNATYTYTVSKPGYQSVEGSITVEDDDRYVIIITLPLAVAPTTPGPTLPPGATPGATPGETPGIPPEESFVQQSAKAFAEFLGVSISMGQAALGIIISSAAGYATARHLRGGAPEFGAGFLVAAALTTVIGLLPVWIFVVMVLIMGVLIGYKFMGNG